MNRNKIISSSAGVYVLLFILCLLAFPISLIAGRYVALSLPEDKSWKTETSPLLADVVNDLCSKLFLPRDPICSGNSDVYAQDFYSAISRNFDKEDTTYQYVQQSLGKYQIELEPIEYSNNGYTYFVSYYDLRGDGYSKIVFFFYGNYEDNHLMRIHFHSGGPNF